MMQKPQIIVIPQHLLSEQSKNFLRQRQVLPASTNKPIAAVMGNQRPVPAISPELKPILKRPLSPVKTELLDDQPARKRANLDHLSAEERLMRRKLKNRVAAQTARDKKKAYIDDLEAVLSNLREEHNQTLQENSRLQAANTSLQVENASLHQQNKELQARLGQFDATTDLLPMSPESLPRSPSPPSTSCPTTTSPSALSSPEPAALAPLPQETDDRRQHSRLDPGLSSNDLTTWSINCVAQMLMWSAIMTFPLRRGRSKCVLSAPTSSSTSPTLTCSTLKAVPRSVTESPPPPAPDIPPPTLRRLPPKKRNLWTEREAWLVAPPLC